MTLLMIFGTVTSVAYESYDTYTYSIDGEALPSPHAYTPDVEIYDSSSMGLLAGYYWTYEGDKVALWNGEMTPDTFDFEYSSVGISYLWDEETSSYVAEKYAKDFTELISQTFRLSDLIKEYQSTYPAAEGSAVVTVTLSDLEGLTLANALELFTAKADAKIAEAKALPENEGKAISLEINSTEIIARMNELMAEHPDGDTNQSHIRIPDVYDDGIHGEAPVTAIADGFISNLGWTDSHAESSALKIYRGTYTVIIGENVTSIGSSAFEGAPNINKIFTEAREDEWNSVTVGSNNKVFTSAAMYYYSEDIKFGNTPLSGSSDIVADYQGNLYIADAGNNRILILNKYDYKTIGVIKTYTDEYGRTQNFSSPAGVFVTDPTLMVDGSQEIFVCDTNNKRIVVFDTNYQYLRTIEEPENALLEENDFVPKALAVDLYGRIFVVSPNCTKGVIVLSNTGEFTGFIGAQKVTTSLIDQIWERFQSAEDRLTGSRNLSIPFNNITVDDEGFVYVTINFTKQEHLSQQLSSITSKSATYSPVKKLNSRGVEIMKRNGFFDPGGEVVRGAGTSYRDVSKIVDVALGNEGTWTILDNSRSRLYTYDQNGNLLFAFGDKGQQVGNGVAYSAMTYQVVDGVYNLVLLDSTGGTSGVKLSVFHPTEYCDMIMEALHNQNIHNYSATIDNWQKILTSNNNFDLAYIGIGKALYSQGHYEEAMEMLSSAYETDYYAKAFAEVRKDNLSQVLILLVLGIIVVVVALVKFLGWAKKKNKATSLKVGRKTYGEEMLYVFHIIFHPFDGFWDLKHEKRGSVRAAATIMGITVVAFFYQSVGQGYMFNPRGSYSTIIAQIISVLVPILLWVLGNWCLTTLFDGEGSMKDIFIATGYALAPLPIFVVISTVLTNVFTNSEGESSIVSLLVTFAYIWVGLLLFFGMAVTHDYSTGKNFVTTLGTIVAMCVIMFIVILFSSLVMKMATFLISLISELVNRLT